MTRQNELLQSIFDNIPVMLAVYDRSGKVTSINRALESTLGWSLKEWQCRDLLAECYPDPKYRQEVGDCRLEESTEWRDFKTRVRTGLVIDTSWYNVALSDGRGVGIGQDITQRKWTETALRESEQRIRELATESVRAHEEERQWSALEVHDRIAQPLAAVFQQIQTLKDKAGADPTTRRVAEGASILLQEAIRESRNIMNDLYPAGLSEFGILALVEEELDSFEEDTECLVAFDADCPVRPPGDAEITLYRIFHEALTNVRKHAPDAKKVAISLACSDQAVVLQVRDDGPGFQVETVEARKRVGGLMSMRRRTEVIGGTFDIWSSPGQGTRLTVQIPIDSSGPDEGPGYLPYGDPLTDEPASE